MKVRINRRLYRVFALDIESHNDDESIKMMKTSCRLGCLLDENSTKEDPSSYFYSIEEALDKLEKLSTPKYQKKKGEKRPCKNIVVYIYNLSFEWSFFLPVLLKKGFTFKEKIEDDDEFVFNSISTKSVSSVWLAKFKFSKKGGVILFKDLAKIFSGGLSSVAKSFNLPTQKGEINYRLNRLHNYTITEEEKDYCFKDTRIIIDILLIMNNREDKTFFNSASASTYAMKELLKVGWPRKVKPYKEFRELYPELDEEENAFLREGVEGGITYPVSSFQFKEINQPIGHIDAHQMHPSSAFYNLFPYGKGEYFKGKPPMGRISACRIKISYDDVKLHSIIKLIGLPFVSDKEIVVWSFEIPTMLKCYVNLKIEFIEGYAYKMKPLKRKRFYALNYSKRLEAKKKKDQFGIAYYKLLNNSSYGKLLEKPHNEIFENYIRDDGIIDSVVSERPITQINARFTYLPVGSAIPAYSRVNLIETALLFGYENILYFDTDSIFFLWNEKTKAVRESNLINKEDFLGGWGWEELIDKAQFTAPKRYKLKVGDETIVKSAGINFKDYLSTHNELEFEEINIVSSVWRVQRAYRVEGGTIIEFQNKEMKIVKKYESIYNKNINDTI